MATPSVHTFDAEGRAVDFEVWVDDLQLFLQCDRTDGLSLFDLTSGVSPAPPATADSTVRSQWASRDAAARLAVRRHLPTTERAHFSQYKSAQTLYDAVVARYSSPATAALSRLFLPYLFPDLTAFPTVADLITHLRTSDTRFRAALPAEFCAKNPPPMYLTLYYVVTQAPLQTLHMDVWGPARVRGLGHEHYFLLVVDDYSHYTTVFPLRSKGEVTEVLIDWIRAARLRLRESFGSEFLVLRLHSDRGGEFSSARLGAFCRAQGIRQTFTLPASPQQNGIAERHIGMVMDVARTSMIHAAAPHFLWPFAVQYAVHQLNLQPRVSLPETSPTLLWTEKVGDVSAFRVWGSRAFVRDLSADKLSPRATPCVFLGFPQDAPGWQFYHPTSRRVLSSKDVTFDESVPHHRLFPYRTAPLPPPPLFLAPGPPPVDPLPPQGPAPSGVSQVDAVEPVEVVVDSGAATGAEPAGAGSGGTGSRGAVPGGAESGGAEPGELCGDVVIHPELVLLCLTGLVTSCSPPLCLWGAPITPQDNEPLTLPYDQSGITSGPLTLISRINDLESHQPMSIDDSSYAQRPPDPQGAGSDRSFTFDYCGAQGSAQA
ncbi:unnamed protein product [Closterium sp. NIES-53]